MFFVDIAEALSVSSILRVRLKVATFSSREVAPIADTRWRALLKDHSHDPLSIVA